MRKYILSEQLWRRAMKEKDVVHKRISIVALILIALIVGAILVALL
jgi:hypothetical protein